MKTAKTLNFFLPLTWMQPPVDAISLAQVTFQNLTRESRCTCRRAKKRCPIIYLALAASLLSKTSGQGFANLDFEGSQINNTVVQVPGGSYTNYFAYVPGWAAYGTGVSNYSGGTKLSYNSRTLDSPGVTLEGVTYTIPAIEGNYSVLLQGGSSFYPGREGASIWQTGEIPLWARSLTYWGTSTYSEATFSGEPLFFLPIANAGNHVVYGANISAYAGQTGELRFTAPWQTMGILDAIQFSPLEIPEPRVAVLIALAGGLALLRRTRSK